MLVAQCCYHTLTVVTFASQPIYNIASMFAMALTVGDAYCVKATTSLTCMNHLEVQLLRVSLGHKLLKPS